MAAATTNPILAKIKKLLALSEGRGTTEAEASLAAEHVQRMLQDHGLTLAQVEAAGGGSDETTKRDKITTDLRALYEYQRSLMQALAENNFCFHKIAKVRTTKGSGGEELGYTRISHRHFLIGRELNVQVTLMSYGYLCEAIRRTATDAGYTAKDRGGKQNLNRFAEGAVSRIVERLNERRRQQEEESARTATARTSNGSHTELVLSDVYGTEADLNNDALNNFPAGTTATERHKTETRRAAQQATHDRLVAEGVDSTVAWYKAYGYSDEDATRSAASFARSSRRGGRGRTRNWTRGDEAHYAKINSASYRAGRVAGAGIGLDDQVGAARTKRLGKEV